MADLNEPKVEALCTQLNELNARGRWYSAQLWAVPLTYLGLNGVIVFGVIDKASDYFHIALLVSGILGIFVIWHMLGIKDGERRAVQHLQNLEDRLNLDRTVEYKDYTSPFLLAVSTVVIASIICAIIIMCNGRAS